MSRTICLLLAAALPAAPGLALNATSVRAQPSPPSATPNSVSAPTARPTSSFAAVPGTVDLRFGGGRIAGRIISIDDSGLTIVPDIGDPEALIWSRVASVSGPAEPLFSANYAALADGLWRLEARASRGDAEGAELLFDRLEAAGTLAPLSGASQRATLRTVTGIRLSRGFITGAVRSFAQSLAATGFLVDDPASISALAGPAAPANITASTSDSAQSLFRQAVDPATGLPPNLPPALSTQLSGGGIAVLAAWPGWSSAVSLPGNAGEVARWYEAEAIAAAGGKPELFDGPLTPLDASSAATAGPEVLTRAVVQASRGSADQRKSARLWLQKRLAAEIARAKSAEARADSKAVGARVGEDGLVERTWQEAWCRLGLGRSLLTETDMPSRRRGTLELLHIPAEFSEQLPVAAALALAEVAAELESQGDSATAQALRADLRQLIPGGGLEPGVPPSQTAGSISTAAAASGGSGSPPPPPVTANPLESEKPQ